MLGGSKMWLVCGVRRGLGTVGRVLPCPRSCSPYNKLLNPIFDLCGFLYLFYLKQFLKWVRSRSTDMNQSAKVYGQRKEASPRRVCIAWHIQHVSGWVTYLSLDDMQTRARRGQDEGMKGHTASTVYTLYFHNVYSYHSNKQQTHTVQHGESHYVINPNGKEYEQGLYM